MGLKETFQSIAQTVVAATGTVRKTVTYTSKSANPSYNPATGVVTESDQTYTVLAIVDMSPGRLSSISLESNPNLAVNTNKTLIYIAKLDLTPTPKLTDEILIDSVTWEVTDINIDPADALWILAIKRQ